MFRQFVTIARNTFLESIRQPTFAVVMFVMAIVLLLTLQITGYTFGEDNRMFISSGMSIILLGSAVLAGFTASSVISNEIENKTVLTTISKPVGRPLFVLGKFLGIAVALTIAYWAVCMMFLMMVRHGVQSTASDKIDWPVVVFSLTALIGAILFAGIMNYAYRWNFPSTFVVTLTAGLSLAFVLVLFVGKKWVAQSITAEFVAEDSPFGELFIAILLGYQSAIFIVAVAVAISTRCKQVTTVFLSIATYLGVMVLSSALRFSINEQSRWNDIAEFVGRVVPNYQYFWHADALVDGTHADLPYILTVTGYGSLHVLAMLLLAVALFQTREVG